jgi:hypothetical protein
MSDKSPSVRLLLTCVKPSMLSAVELPARWAL